MLNLHDVISRAYGHAVSSPIDQFRSVALTSISDFFGATGAFWGFSSGIDDHDGNSRAVISIGDTPGAHSGLEHYGPANPNWPKYPPSLPTLLPIDGEVVPADGHLTGLHFCSPLPYKRGFQLISLYFPSETNAKEAQNSGDFFTLALHATRACEIAMRQLIAPQQKEVVPQLVKAVCTYNGRVLFGPRHFEELMSELKDGDVPDQLRQGVEERFTSVQIGRFSFERFGGMWVVGIDTSGILDRLTRRQAQVAKLITQGLTDKEIALRLGLSTSTVSNHVKDILKRLKTTSRVKVREVLADAAN